jgi:hypothetical protein
VQHGDLRADNVVVSSDGLPSLIDLSHARAHACKGEGACAELRDGWALFGLGQYRKGKGRRFAPGLAGGLACARQSERKCR